VAVDGMMGWHRRIACTDCVSFSVRQLLTLPPLLALLTLTLAAGAALVLQYLGIPPVDTSLANNKLAGWDWPGIVLFSPLLETLLLGGAFKLMASRLDRRLAALLAALLLAGMHEWYAGGWGWVVLAPLCVFTAPFALIRRFRDAALLGGLTHAFHNFYACILISWFPA
jgi:hypothetical protein